MPVNRKRVEVRMNAGGGGVTPGARGAPTTRAARFSNAPAQAWQQFARLTADRAADFSRAMATAAEEEGLALAKAATFSMDEMGTPQMPENATKRMGTIAQRAYDGAMEERYAHQLTTAVRAQLSDAQNANLHDQDAFADDAMGRLEQMQESVPEHMQGAFQQISTGLMADFGAQIGRRMGQQAIRDMSEQTPMAADDMGQGAVDHVWSGHDDIARMMVDDTFEMIDNTGTEIMGPKAKREKKKDVLLGVAVARITRDFDLNDTEDPAKIQSIANDLIAGEDEELLKYFEHEGFDADKRELARSAASHLNGLLGEANRKGRERRARAEKSGQIAVIREGGARETEKNRVLLDEDLSRRAKLRREDGNGYREINMYDWANMEDEQRHSLVALSKDAGFRPESMNQFFRAAMRGDEPELLAAGFELYRDLREAPNTRGESGMDLTADLPAKVKEVYGIAEMLHGSGDVGQEGIQEAFRLWDDLKTEGDWTDEQWGRSLHSEGMGTGLLGRGRIDGDNWQDVLDGHIEDEILDGVLASDAERKEAREIFKTYYRAGSGMASLEDVTEMTRQSMEGRWMDSEYIAQRSSYAPEKWYPEPGADGFLDALLKADRAANDAIFKFLGIEKGEGVWSLGLSENGIFEESFTRARVNTFDIVAHGEIKRLVEEHENPMVRENFAIDNDLYIGGRDYMLKPASKGTPPVYRVMMKAQDGTYHSAGTLDVREKYEDLTRMDINFRAREDALQDRKGKMLREKFGDAGIDKLIADELAKDPDRDPADIIEEFWGQEFEMGDDQ